MPRGTASHVESAAADVADTDIDDDDTIAAGLSTSQDSTTDSFTSDPNSASSSDVAVGQIVIAPFKGNKYFRARILSYREKRFFKINFDDGTTSEYVTSRDDVAELSQFNATDV